MSVVQLPWGSRGMPHTFAGAYKAMAMPLATKQSRATTAVVMFRNLRDDREDLNSDSSRKQ